VESLRDDFSPSWKHGHVIQFLKSTQKLKTKSEKHKATFELKMKSAK
jgi:hypothetical protein